MNIFWKRPFRYFGPDAMGYSTDAIVTYQKYGVEFRVIDRGERPDGRFERVATIFKHTLLINLWICELRFIWKS